MRRFHDRSCVERAAKCLCLSEEMGPVRQFMRLPLARRPNGVASRLPMPSSKRLAYCSTSLLPLFQERLLGTPPSRDIAQVWALAAMVSHDS